MMPGAKGRCDLDIPYQHVDCTRPEQVHEAVRGHAVGTVYHLAALLSAVAEGRPQVAWAVNMAAHYSVSPRRWDGVLRAPGHREDHRIRKVRHNDEIRWRGNTIYLNQALEGEPVGLAGQADGSWLVRYGPVELGVIEHRGKRLKRPKPKARGLVDNPAGLPTTPPAQQQQKQT